MRESTAPHPPVFDYANAGWPRDFDIRIEVAEQREILQDPQWRQVMTPAGRPRPHLKARLRGKVR